MVAVFLVRGPLAFNRFDAAARPALSAQAHAPSRVSTRSPLSPAPPQEFDACQPDAPRYVLRGAWHHAPSRKPDPEGPDVDPDAQMAASNTPIADPSTFSSEAYQVIYSN